MLPETSKVMFDMMFLSNMDLKSIIEVVQKRKKILVCPPPPGKNKNLGLNLPPLNFGLIDVENGFGFWIDGVKPNIRCRIIGFQGSILVQVLLGCEFLDSHNQPGVFLKNFFYFRLRFLYRVSFRIFQY